MKFRPLAISLAESMSKVVDLEPTAEALFNYYKTAYAPAKLDSIEGIELIWQTYDHRIGWATYLVRALIFGTSCEIGYTNGPFEDRAVAPSLLNTNFTSNSPYYSDPKDPTFQKDFIEVFSLAGKAQVSFSLEYVDGPNLWYGRVSSSVPAEEFEGKEHSLSIAMQDLLKHLRSL